MFRSFLVFESLGCRKALLVLCLCQNPKRSNSVDGLVNVVPVCIDTTSSLTYFCCTLRRPGLRVFHPRPRYEHCISLGKILTGPSCINFHTPLHILDSTSSYSDSASGLTFTGHSSSSRWSRIQCSSLCMSGWKSATDAQRTRPASFSDKWNWLCLLHSASCSILAYLCRVTKYQNTVFLHSMHHGWCAHRCCVIDRSSHHSSTQTERWRSLRISTRSWGARWDVPVSSTSVIPYVLLATVAVRGRCNDAVRAIFSLSLPCQMCLHRNLVSAPGIARWNPGDQITVTTASEYIQNHGGVARTSSIHCDKFHGDTASMWCLFLLHSSRSACHWWPTGCRWWSGCKRETHLFISDLSAFGNADGFSTWLSRDRKEPQSRRWTYPFFY